MSGIPKNNSQLLVEKYPNLIKQWNDSSNREHDIKTITVGSKKMIVWNCDKGHQYSAIVSNRVKGSNCPYCANKKVLKGFNDIETLYPQLIEQWHPTKNKNKLISNYTKGSRELINWVCSNKHEWEASIKSRFNVEKVRNCPICINQKLLIGYNDLKTTNPQIALEWNYALNNKMLPSEFLPGSTKKVWWLGNCGHEWEASINARTNKSKATGCPYCANKKVTLHTNDLLSLNPQLASEWHPILNTNIYPNNVFAHSHKKVWWLGECGHEWEASISSRNKGASCPYCANHKLLQGFNDFGTLHPELAKEWHPTLNNINPFEVIEKSGIRIWWQCNKKHEWETQLNDRVFYQTQCPTCSANSFSSKAEKEISQYITDLGLKVERNIKKFNFELDIFIPEKQIAIEYNGLYWHSEEKGKTRYYHYNKWLKCKDQGIQLIQIWEDNWTYNANQIKNMLNHKLGFSSQERVFARKTEIVKISKHEAEQFLNINHIQGYASGSYYLGLQKKETLEKELVAVLVLKKESIHNLNIVRYATNSNVIGGFTKMLNFVIKTYSPHEIITFSDNTVSDGALYKNNGFSVDKDILPDYMYVIKGHRKHKFGYRLNTFKNSNEYIYKENLTEKELAKLNGLTKIWDAGKIKWRLVLK
jgi:G:T-mismatch repair DNA endonuclease (very short patch repair protein)